MQKFTLRDNQIDELKKYTNGRMSSIPNGDEFNIKKFEQLLMGVDYRRRKKMIFFYALLFLCFIIIKII